jgi:hypothetical protein
MVISLKPVRIANKNNFNAGIEQEMLQPVVNE